MGLSASVGQMSEMVFAIEKRGRSGNGKGSSRIEVGSWVIGFWRPKKHFEINVWNCFENKMRRLLKGLEEAENIDLGLTVKDDIDSFLSNGADVTLRVCSALKLLEAVPDESIDLVITDPPHGDRIPYLELSEIWNSLLDKEPIFEDEIIVSNARERKKTRTEYKEALAQVFQVLGRKIKSRGIVAVMFNSKSEDEWHSLENVCQMSKLVYLGKFPMRYSAGSVVQDNRSGGLSYDYVLLFGRSNGHTRNKEVVNRFSGLSGWSNGLPVETQ